MIENIVYIIVFLGKYLIVCEVNSVEQ